MGKEEDRRNKISTNNIKKRNKALKSSTNKNERLNETVNNKAVENLNIEKYKSDKIPIDSFKIKKPVSEDYLIFNPTVEGKLFLINYSLLNEELSSTLKHFPNFHKLN